MARVPRTSASLPQPWSLPGSPCGPAPRVGLLVGDRPGERSLLSQRLGHPCGWYPVGLAVFAWTLSCHPILLVVVSPPAPRQRGGCAQARARGDRSLSSTVVRGPRSGAP